LQVSKQRAASKAYFWRKTGLFSAAARQWLLPVELVFCI
jgi:hypothetical protein